MFYIRKYCICSKLMMLSFLRTDMRVWDLWKKKMFFWNWFTLKRIVFKNINKPILHKMCHQFYNSSCFCLSRSIFFFAIIARNSRLACSVLAICIICSIKNETKIISTHIKLFSEVVFLKNFRTEIFMFHILYYIYIFYSSILVYNGHHN